MEKQEKEQKVLINKLETENRDLKRQITELTQTLQLQQCGVRKSSPIIEGNTKSNVKNNTQIGRLAPPPLPPPSKRHD